MKLMFSRVMAFTLAVFVFGFLMRSNADAANVNYSVNLVPSMNITLSSNNITLNMNPTLTVFDSEDLSITVSTNNSTGYSLIMTSEGTDLVRTQAVGGTTPVIPTLATKAGGYTESEFTTNAWGYKTSGAYYYPFVKNVEVASSNAPVSNASSTVTLGSKVDTNLPVGSYGITLNFVALAKYAGLTMQNLDPAFCTTVPTYVEDSRDNAIYLIQRLEDGNCWMLDNLGFSDLNYEMTASDTNIASGTTYQFPQNARVTSFASNETEQFRDADKNTIVDKFGFGSGKVGTYYNYYAVSAGTYSAGMGSLSYDICPAGWRLPNSQLTSGTVIVGEFDDLFDSNNQHIDKALASLSATRAGAYSSTPWDVGLNIFYWSSSAYVNSNTYRNVFYYNGSNGYFDFVNGVSDSLGVPVRCVMKDNGDIASICNGSSALYCKPEELSKGTTTNSSFDWTSVTVPTSSIASEDSSTSGVYEWTGDDGNNGTLPIYFYRGILESSGNHGSQGSSETYPNYVKLGNGTCWRIVRTTSTGGVKLVYNGLYGATTTGSCANASSAASLPSGGTQLPFNNAGPITVDGYSLTNGMPRINAHAVGYTFSTVPANTQTEVSLATLFGATGNDTTTNSKNSLIKQYIEQWYANNMTKYTSMLEGDAGYCQDRSAYGDDNGTPVLRDDSYMMMPTSETGAATFNFGAYMRNNSSSFSMFGPSLECPRGKVDLYSYVSEMGNGNGQLSYPVALLTADEADMAGHGPGLSGNYGGAYSQHSYLQTGLRQWLLSPAYRANGSGENLGAEVLLIEQGNGGSLVRQIVNYNYTARPVITFKYGTVVVSGSGTATDPWLILE